MKALYPVVTSEDVSTIRGPSGYKTRDSKVYALLAAEKFFREQYFGFSYARKSLGEMDRAPIAAVVFDLVDLIMYMVRISPVSEPQTVEWWLKDFYRLHPNLRALHPNPQSWDERESELRDFSRWMSVRPYLHDIVIIATGTYRILPWDFRGNSDSTHFETLYSLDVSLWGYRLPGPEVLIGHPPIDPVSVVDGPIEEVDAAFVSSGPFKIRLTKNISDNLQLNVVKRELLVYWEDDFGLFNNTTDLSGIGQESKRPGRLDQYENGHGLGKFVLIHKLRFRLTK